MSVSPLIIHPYVSYPDITHAQLDKHLQESFLRPNLHLKAEKQHDPSCQGGGRSEHSPLNICIRFAPATSGWGWRRWRRAFELQSAQKSALQGETRRAGPERDSDRRRRTLQPLVNQKKHTKLIEIFLLSNRKQQRKQTAARKPLMKSRVIFPPQQGSGSVCWPGGVSDLSWLKASFKSSSRGLPWSHREPEKPVSQRQLKEPRSPWQRPLFPQGGSCPTLVQWSSIRLQPGDVL